MPEQIRPEKLEFAGPDGRFASDRHHPVTLRDRCRDSRHRATRDLRPGGLNASEKSGRGCRPRNLFEDSGQWARSGAPHAATALGPVTIRPSSTRTRPPPAAGAPGT
jgi:hypothetical protein